MPKAPQLESGRTRTHLQVCGTPPAGSASASAALCGLGQVLLLLAPWFLPTLHRRGQLHAGVRDEDPGSLSGPQDGGSEA